MELGVALSAVGEILGYIMGNGLRLYEEIGSWRTEPGTTVVRSYGRLREG